MMNLQNRYDTQQGFVQFIIPAQQWSTSIVSHRSSQDSLPRHHRYIYLQIGRAANLQDSPTSKVEIIRNRLLKLVASTLVIIQEVDSHISNPWSNAQPAHAVQGRRTKDSIFPKFPRFVSVVGSNIFVQQLNFPHPRFPHHCNKRPLGTLHMVPVYVLRLPQPPTYIYHIYLSTIYFFPLWIQSLSPSMQLPSPSKAPATVMIVTHVTK